MRPIRLRCPNPKCRVILAIPQQMRGQRVKCAGCGQTFPVPVLPADRPAGGKRHRKAS